MAGMKTGKTKNLSRRQFMSGVSAAVVLGASQRPLPKAARPNVLFILGDDLGYGDLSCFGRPDYSTPNLDRLAAQGMRFTNAYAASPVCTPTRCAFITGRYPARTPVGLEEPLGWHKQVGNRVGLSPDHPTVASLLRKNGYETALIGKWHLGYLPDFGPTRSGFDEFFGILSGGADYFTHKDANGDLDLYEGAVPVERIGYMTDLLTGRAVEYISRRKRGRPFYLSLHYTAPHWPWEGPGDEQVSRTLMQGYAGLTAGGSLKTYASMMKSLDDGVGKVLKALRTAGLERDTLVIFTSDNGGERFSFNWPFSGQKQDLLEGGIRVPAIVRWPGVIPARVSTEQVAITMDWTATILGAAQANAAASHPLDGNDLIPVCRGARDQYERTLFWRHGDQDAVRRGKWKYLRNGAREYLFDLAVDQREHADFKGSNPEVFRQLKSVFESWEAQVLARPAGR
ncbi:MAG TPA: sulfatase-like hydrolase/transferase [Blastocatellia bacterium]|nr:sulfatase-like hydrolase/transferase [Blastocatellia bacterium]